MRLDQPVVDITGRYPGAAALSFRLDQRAKIGELHRHRRRRLLAVGGSRPVRGMGLEQALDQPGPTLPGPIVEVQGVNRVSGRSARHHAEGFAD